MSLIRIVTSAFLLFALPFAASYAEGPTPIGEATCGKLGELYEKFTSPVACSTVRQASPKKMGETFKEDYALYNEYCVTCDYVRLKRPGYSDLDIALRELPNDRDLTPQEVERLREVYVNDLKGRGKSANATTAQNVGGLHVSQSIIPGDARSPVTVSSLTSVGISEDDARTLLQQLHAELQTDFDGLSLARGEMMDAMGKANNAITNGKNEEKAPACLNLLRARQNYFDREPAPKSDKKSKKKSNSEEGVGLKQVAQKSWSTLISTAFDRGCKASFVKQWCSNIENADLRTACEVRSNLLSGKTDGAEILENFKTHVLSQRKKPSSTSTSLEKSVNPASPGTPKKTEPSEAGAVQDPNKQ